MQHQYPLKNRKPESDCVRSTAVTARLLASFAHRTVDYMYSTDENSQRRHNLEHLLHHFIKPRSPAWNQSRCAGLLHRWQDHRSSVSDKLTAAALALWYTSPVTAYRITLHFDEKYIAKGFDYTRDELTRHLKKHGIKESFVVFEVSRSKPRDKSKAKKWRLHCHAMAQIPAGTDIEALEQSLVDRFLKDEAARDELTVFGNKIADIDRVIYSPKEHKAPEYWATYALKNVEITKALLGWDTVHYIAQPLVKPARRVYYWMRKPTPDSFPIMPNRGITESNEPIDAEVELMLTDFANCELSRNTADDELSALDRLSAELTDATGVKALAENWNNTVSKWVGDVEKHLYSIRHTTLPVNHYSRALHRQPKPCIPKKGVNPASPSRSTNHASNSLSK